MFVFLPILRIGPFFVSVSAVFQSAKLFNGDLSSWNVGKVSNMASSTYITFPLFKSCLGVPFLVCTDDFQFDQMYVFLPILRIGHWDIFVSVSAVFACAEYFNGDLSSWNVSEVTNTESSTYLIHFPSSIFGLH